MVRPQEDWQQSSGDPQLDGINEFEGVRPNPQTFKKARGDYDWSGVDESVATDPIPIVFGKTKIKCKLAYWDGSTRKVYIQAPNDIVREDGNPIIEIPEASQINYKYMLSMHLMICVRPFSDTSTKPADIVITGLTWNGRPLYLRKKPSELNDSDNVFNQINSEFMEEASDPTNPQSVPTFEHEQTTYDSNDICDPSDVTEGYFISRPWWNNAKPDDWEEQKMNKLNGSQQYGNHDGLFGMYRLHGGGLRDSYYLKTDSAESYFFNTGGLDLSKQDFKDSSHFKNMVSIFFEKMHIGKQPRIPKIEAEVKYQPVIAGDAYIDPDVDDANPVCILHELLSYKNHSDRNDSETIILDTPSFKAGAKKIQEEQLFISFAIRGRENVGTIVNKLIKIIDGSIYTKVNNAGIDVVYLKLRRENLVEQSFTLNDSNVKTTVNISSVAWHNLPTSAHLNYTDRGDLLDYNRETVSIYSESSLANNDGRRNPLTIDIPEIHNSASARLLAARALRQSLSPKKKIALACTRELRNVVPSMQIPLTASTGGVNGDVLLVSKVVLGDREDGTVGIQGTIEQDITNSPVYLRNGGGFNIRAGLNLVPTPSPYFWSPPREVRNTLAPSTTVYPDGSAPVILNGFQANSTGINIYSRIGDPSSFESSGENLNHIPQSIVSKVGGTSYPESSLDSSEAGLIVEGSQATNLRFSIQSVLARAEIGSYQRQPVSDAVAEAEITAGNNLILVRSVDVNELYETTTVRYELVHFDGFYYIGSLMHGLPTGGKIRRAIGGTTPIDWDGATFFFLGNMTRGSFPKTDSTIPDSEDAYLKINNFDLSSEFQSIRSIYHTWSEPLRSGSLRPNPPLINSISRTGNEVTFNVSFFDFLKTRNAGETIHLNKADDSDVYDASFLATQPMKYVAVSLLDFSLPLYDGTIDTIDINVEPILDTSGTSQDVMLTNITNETHILFFTDYTLNSETYRSPVLVFKI